MMEKFAVIGHPIGHTMSPFVHKALFELSGFDGEYAVIDVEPSDLKSQLRNSLAELRGFNVTIPHKESIFSMLDSIDKSAHKCGAVNCVKRDKNKFCGFNTDAYGFVKALESNGLSLNGNILILGAGGAAATIARAAIDNDCCVTVAVRKSGFERAIALKERLKPFGREISVTTLDSITGHFDLCVNATPVGMYPSVDASPVGDDVLKNCSAVFDVVYNPTETALLKLARKNGLKVVGGMPMLIWQAVKAHEIWYGQTFEVAEIEKIIDAANKEMERIFYEK